MARKSYRSHGLAEDASPLAAIIAALGIGLALAAPWLLIAGAIVVLQQWATG
jgi:hypothetical protein